MIDWTFELMHYIKEIYYVVLVLYKLTVCLESRKRTVLKKQIFSGRSVLRVIGGDGAAMAMVGGLSVVGVCCHSC